MAITTLFDGIEFRSRLEARWASFFRRIGWEFTYEPFDGDGYIPDFLIHGDDPLLVEVKPAVTEADYNAPVTKAEKGLVRHWDHDILIVGASPLATCLEEYQLWPGFDTAGLLGQFDTFDKGVGWWWAPALWAECPNCHNVAVMHSEAGYNGRPHGCYNGGHGLEVVGYDHWHRVEKCTRPIKADTGVTINGAWASACNDVKWHGRAA